MPLLMSARLDIFSRCRADIIERAVKQYPLETAKALKTVLNLMIHSHQLSDRTVIVARLQHDRSAAGPVMSDSVGIHRLLNVHTEIDQIHQNHYMTLSLHHRSGEAKADPGLSIFGNKGRYDGVKWAFAGSIAVHVPLLEGKSRSPVLQRKTKAGRCDKRAEQP